MDNKCEKKWKPIQVLALYGELTSREQEKFETHLEKCETCRREYRELQENMEQISLGGSLEPEPDWDKSWQVIKQGVRVERNRTPITLFPGWVLKIAAAVVIFALGIFAGKLLFFSSPGVPTRDNARAVKENLVPLFKEHFKEVSTTFVEYTNYTPRQDETLMLFSEKDQVSRLLSRNRLLKNALVKEEDRQLKQLLEELEVVLMEIANLGENNPDYLVYIKELLNEKQILFRMRYLALENKEICII